tara:strand:+ start:2364 stop:3488 length:1125 start_codon:yes stop_codon:yes gene_type:complete
MQNNNLIYRYYYEWWKNIDKTIFSLIIFLFILGLFFSLVSTSLIASDKLNTNDYFFFFKHLAYILLGILIIIFFSSLSRQRLFILSTILFLVCLITLILVPFIGVEVKGSKRWLDLLFLPRFQPIELLKPFTIIVLALILGTEKKINIFVKYFFTFLIILTITFFLIIQPDIGQTLLLLFCWSVLIFISGVSLILFLSFFGVSLFSLICMIMLVPKFEYVQNRILSFFDRSGGTHNFQSDKAIEAIVSGGFFGKGLGEGTLKNRVPEAHTDYIVSVISEEFGIIAIILLLVFFLSLIFIVFKKISFEQNDKVKLILVGSVSLILMQAIIHLGVNIRLFPTTGMTLPFLSYGGSSIVSVSILSGIILNLTKRKIN